MTAEAMAQAGGSEGIHKITRVYRNFMERSSESLSKPVK